MALSSAVCYIESITNVDTFSGDHVHSEHWWVGSVAMCRSNVMVSFPCQGIISK